MKIVFKSWWSIYKRAQVPCFFFFVFLKMVCLFVSVSPGFLICLGLNSGTWLDKCCHLVGQIRNSQHLLPTNDMFESKVNATTYWPSTHTQQKHPRGKNCTEISHFFMCFSTIVICLFPQKHSVFVLFFTIFYLQRMQNANTFLQSYGML